MANLSLTFLLIRSEVIRSCSRNAMMLSPSNTRFRHSTIITNRSRSYRWLSVIGQVSFLVILNSTICTWTPLNLFCTGDNMTYQEIKGQILKHLRQAMEPGQTKDDLIGHIDSIVTQQGNAELLNRAESYNAKRLGEESIRVILRLLLDV
ncbi:hypothetical protein RsoM2USA_298 [Ralstonia phage RsoM2USA]|nr:hypothetical protein RsoM2USA_298 [Ralstonia phage RsoM2USA]